MYLYAYRTLDYIFVSKHWIVSKAAVRPRPCPPLIENPNGHEENAEKIDYESSLENAVQSPLDGVIDGPQPSAFWPSDHMLVQAELWLE